MKRNLKLLLLPAVFMLPAICGPAGAIELVVPVDFALTPPGDYNRMSLTVTLLGTPDTDTADVTGTMRADLYLDYNPATHVATVTGIGFVKRDPPPGNLTIGDMHLSYWGGWEKIDITGLRGDLDTPSPPIAVSGGQFPFPPSPEPGHFMTLNAGLIEASGIYPYTFNLAEDPIYSRLTGAEPGTISLSEPYNIVGPQASFDATLIVPISFNEVVSENPSVTASGGGRLRGVGSFTVVPEPSSLLLLLAGLSALLCYAWQRR